ncbi:MAG: hypothetical protein MK110_05725 [Fuerstiella sp.]|nr:hypothetical protein [Fuerstiella sp.]
MSRVVFWLRVAAGTVWGLIVLAALKSAPAVHALIGDQYAVTQHWCGPWGCSASLPKLLAWQVPVALVFVPAAWVLARRIGPVSRCPNRWAVAVAVIPVCWLAFLMVRAAVNQQFTRWMDPGLFLVFSSVSGSSVVLPLFMSASAVFLAGRSSSLPTNADAGRFIEPAKRLNNINVHHVDAAR